MTPLAHLVLLATPVLLVVLFRRFPARRVVIGGYVVGMLFLPEFRAAGSVPGVPDPLTLPGFKVVKPNVLAAGLLVGSVLFDRRRWRATRPRWFDLPVLAWCVGPVISSVANAVVYADPVSRFDPDFARDLMADGRAVTWMEYGGLYDGLVRGAEAALGWAAPYWLGRLYLGDRDGLRELAFGVALGGLVYVPFCLLESRLSPQLHRTVYGFHQHEFIQTMRAGGFRPMAFMEHGLAVGLWLAAAALTAFWLWWNRTPRTVPLPGGRRADGVWAVAALGVTALLCKSSGALALGAAGAAVLLAARATRGPLPVAVLACLAPLYATVRAEGSWDGRSAVALVAERYDPDRAQSLEFRLTNENLLVAKALERPWVGWGGWGRALVYDETGRLVSVADGLWIITLGERGLIGLVSLGLLLLLPVARFLGVHGRRPWVDPQWAAAAALTVVLVLFTADCTMNAMANPVYLLVAGGLIAARPGDPVRQPATPGPVGRFRLIAGRAGPAPHTPVGRFPRLAAAVARADSDPARRT